MQELKELTDKKRAMRHIIRYAEELKLHFNLDDNDTKDLFICAYFHILKEKAVKKLKNMIKLFSPLEK